MFTSVLDGVGWITITHLDSLLPQARAHQVECHYDHTQVEDVNLDRSPFTHFSLIKKVLFLSQ